MDAGAIMQNDTRPENLRALTEACRELGVYSAGTFKPPTALPPADTPESLTARSTVAGLEDASVSRIAPGVCFPWADKLRELPELTGNTDLLRDIWNEIEGLANSYIWQLLLAF